MGERIGRMNGHGNGQQSYVRAFVTLGVIFGLLSAVPAVGIVGIAEGKVRVERPPLIVPQCSSSPIQRARMQLSL